MSGARERALTVACPSCGAAAGEPCSGRAGPRVSVHRARIEAAGASVAYFSRKGGPRSRDQRCNVVGTIYVIEGAQGYYKIGYTRGPVGKRLRELQTGNPVKLRIEMTLTGTERDEQRLHKVFSDKRTVGEWFQLNRIDLVILRRGAK